MDIFRQVLSIAGVLGLLCVMLYVLRRRSGAGVRWRLRAATDRTLQVVERAALTPQHSLHVVRVREDVFLFSAGPGGVALIQKLDTKEERR